MTAEARSKPDLGPTISHPASDLSEKIALTPVIGESGVYVQTSRPKIRSVSQILLLRSTPFTVTRMEGGAYTPISDGEQESQQHTAHVDARTMRGATIIGFKEIMRARRSGKQPRPVNG